MSDELKFPGQTGSGVDRDRMDESFVQLAREAYLPPAPAGDMDAYWSGLEGRIMGRVRGGMLPTVEAGWWSVLGGWAQAGLVAAAAIFAMAGVVNQRLGEGESRVAYESVIEAAESDLIGESAELLNASDVSSQRDATLHYVLSH